MEAADYFEIQNLLHQYCDHLDRGDLDEMGSLFAFANVYLPGSDQWIRRDPRKLADIYRQWVKHYPDGTPRTRHVTTNLIIRPVAGDRVWAQSYVVVHQSTPMFPLQPIIGGRNVDLFEKVDGSWRFCERRIESDMFGDLSSHLLQAFCPDKSVPTTDKWLAVTSTDNGKPIEGERLSDIPLD